MDQRQAHARMIDTVAIKSPRNCHRSIVLCMLIFSVALVPEAVAQQTTIIESDGSESTETLDEVTVEGILPVEVGPRKGLKLSKDQIPGNIQSATGEDIAESRATSLTDFMSQNMQSVNVNEYQGNPFQADVNYRGFTASPQIGTPQGLSVFFDGIRVNEPFGDVVNWDLIPLNAISTFDIFPGSNPLFGLNTLGGALSLRTKNGFDDPGTTVSLLGGSWGRIQGQLSGGGTRGPLGGFVAVTGFHEDGWRDNSPSDVKQGFGKLTLRGDRFELNGSVMLAGTDLLGNGLIPKELYEQNSEAVFTSPDETRNDLRQFSLDGLFAVTNSFNITGQVYRRDSQRRSLAGDIYEDFDNMSQGARANRESEQIAIQPTDFFTNAPLPICQYQDANNDQVADYQLLTDFNTFTPIPGSLNAPLEPFFQANQSTLRQLAIDFLGFNPDNEFTFTDFVGRPGDPPSPFIAVLPPLNGTDGVDCGRVTYQSAGFNRRFNGKQANTGVIEGTPIGVLTKSSIDQVTDGAALQLNFNLDRHVFMVGASVDASRAEYANSQRLGFIDASHKVYEDSENMNPLFLAGTQDILTNQFDGFSNTHSAYFHETFSPFDNLHLTAAGRYNHTRTKTNLLVRTRSARDLASLWDFDAALPEVVFCPSSDPASCPSAPNGNISNDSDNLDTSRSPLQLAGESEKFEYTSFNPSFGINFLPTPDTNIYLNWSQGTRAPSVVELGCAFDARPRWPLVLPDGSVSSTEFVDHPTFLLDGTPTQSTARSLADPFSACTLPTTLSGDPFLPQITARTTEAGMRGTLPNGWEWSGSVYRSNLYDDIYFVGITAERSFFDTIGKTRRQGIELGLSGDIGRFDFNLNYNLNEATFQSPFSIISLHNTSRNFNQEGVPLTARGYPSTDFIFIEPGDRIPGMPLHNLSASVNLHATEKWDVGLTMVAHSSSYVRGNENNDHQSGNPTVCVAFEPTTGRCLQTTETTNTFLPGELPGYMTFNLRSSYAFDRKLTGFVQINNLFDKEFASAGRLGVNPFTPGTLGINGPSGWNYNSAEWHETTFLAPGAPRAFWLGLEYRF